MLCKAYVLPTTLIGIVIISFDEAQKRGNLIRDQMERLKKVTESAEEEMPDFFTEHRYDRLRNVFDVRDLVPICPVS